MTIVIIEDEPHAASALEAMILSYKPDTRVLAHFGSIEDAVLWFSANQHPDLIFCDIHLSDGSSFEIFKNVDIKTPVIFTTAFDEYAIEAFKVNSVDYLLKPIKKVELIAAVSKYENLNKSIASVNLNKLQGLLTNMKIQNTTAKSRFMVKNGQSIKTISSEEVAYFLAEEGVVLLHTFNGHKYAINYTLEELEEQLDRQMFYRANRQLITNIKAVKEVNPYFKGRLLLHVQPATENDQVISSNKASAFKSWLDS